jgi:hypothetical protein
VASSAGEIGNDAANARVLANCAAIAAKLGDPAQGRDLLMRTLHSVSRISDDAAKARILASLAETAAKLDAVEQGHILLDEALHTADRISDDATKALVLTRLPRPLLRSDAAQGRRLLVRSIGSAGKMDDLARAAIFGVVAQGATRLGDPVQGRAVLESIIRATDKIRNELGKARASQCLRSRGRARRSYPRARGAGGGPQETDKIGADFTKTRWLLVPLVEAEVGSGMPRRLEIWRSRHCARRIS